MKRLMLVAAVGIAGLVALADPYTGYYYPAGIAAGSTVRVVVGGQRLWNIKGGWVSGDGVEVVKVERTRGFPVVNGQKQGKWIRDWMYAILDGKPERPPFGVAEKLLLGWNRHPWWENLDTLPPLEFSMVARYLNTPRNPLQMSPSLSERLILTIKAEQGASPGVRDILLYADQGMSAPHPFFVSSLPRHAEPLFAPPPRPKDKPPADPPPIDLPVVLDGQIFPGQTDVFTLHLRKGPVQFSLIGRELQPYLGDAVPGFFNPVLRLTDAAGREVAFADDFHYLPDPVLRCRVPAEGTYRLEVRDNLYRGRDDFVYSIVCTEGKRKMPSPQKRAFVCFPPPLPPEGATGSAEGFVARGALERPGKKAPCEFEVKEPGEWTFSLYARRLGSPLDGVMRLYGPLGWVRRPPLLATWDDVTNSVFVGSVPQGECDPEGTYRFERAGRYRLDVADRVGAGGPHARYTLVGQPTKPSFEVFATKSAFVLHANDRSSAAFRVKVVRKGGFEGAVKLLDTADFMFTSREVPAGTNEAKVVCQPVRRDWTGMRRCDFRARGEVSPGCFVDVPVVPADEAEQAFAYSHLLPAREFSFMMLDIYGTRPTYPTWLEMPDEDFLPRKVLRRHAERPDVATNAVAAFAAYFETEVPIVRPPRDFGEGILLAKLASSAAAARGRREVAAFVPQKGEGGARAETCSALAGVTRLVNADFTYADNEPRRVRLFSRIVERPSDNDVLVYLPEEAANLAASSAGRFARRLCDEGWCLDFATDQALEKIALGRKYRVVCVPETTRPLPQKTADLIATLTGTGKCVAVSATLPERERLKKMGAFARRERLPQGVRFARFGAGWGEGHYLVCNTTRKPVREPWVFNVRGRVRHAVALEVDTGRIVDLQPAGKNGFAYALAPGASAWIVVSFHEFAR